eukprot:2932398-Amphidinium_carterae.1
MFLVYQRALKTHLGETRVACPDSGEHPAVSAASNYDKEVADAVGDEQLPTASSEDAKTCSIGDFFGETKQHSGVTRAVGSDRHLSLMMKSGFLPHCRTCLRDDLSSSDDAEISWASREQVGGTQAHAAHSFASMQDRRVGLYLDAAKHMQELEEDVATQLARRTTAPAERGSARRRQGGVHAALD